MRTENTNSLAFVAAALLSPDVASAAQSTDASRAVPQTYGRFFGVARHEGRAGQAGRHGSSGLGAKT